MRQNRGVSTTKTGIISSRPKIMLIVITHFAKSEISWKVLAGQTRSPMPGPTFESAVATDE